MIVEVKNKKEAKKFIDLPGYLYRNDPEWIAIPDGEIKTIFDPARNNFFLHGKCRRWILLDEKNKAIGRIAAFTNHQKAGSTHAGGIGFFECIHDEKAAHLLFDTAKEWLQSEGMTAMDGPVNFGENDRFWGLLVEGFTSPGYGMNYNPRYYIGLFESYGFVKLYDQLTNVLDVTKPMPGRFTKIADWVASKKEYSFRHFSMAEKEKFFDDFRAVYNDAWCDFENFHPLEPATIRETFRQMKPIMDERIIWFAYHNDEPVAFVVCVPDVNQFLKPFKGRMNLLNKLRFLWYRRTRPAKRLRIIVMGCKRKYQNHGVESALIRCLQNEVLPRRTVKEVELAWVGDFNKKMLALHHATGALPSKVHRTYRYEF